MNNIVQVQDGPVGLRQMVVAFVEHQQQLPQFSTEISRMRILDRTGVSDRDLLGALLFVRTWTRWAGERGRVWS